MKRKLLLIIFVWACAWNGWASTWSCSSGGLPDTCDKTDETSENSCLLHLYSCGQYEKVIQHIQFDDKGLDKTQHFFLGVSYFGLLNSSRTKTLRCFYIATAKAQLEEFMDEVRTVCRNPDDPSTCTHNPVSFGGDSDVDRIYQAMKIQKLLAQETGCTESPHTRVSVLRYARRYANDALSGVAHGIASGASAVEAVLKKGFDELKKEINVFVTVASTLETRYSNYKALLQSAQKQHNDVAVAVSKQLVDPKAPANAPKIVTVTQKVGDQLASVSIDSAALQSFLSNLQKDLNDQGVNPIKTAEAQLDDYFQHNARHYNTIRDDRIKGVKGYLVDSAKYYNILDTENAELKEALAGASGNGKDGSAINPGKIRTSFAEYLSYKKTANPCTQFNKNAWHCK